MPRWKILRRRAIADPHAGGFDSKHAWAVDLENRETGEKHTTRFDVAPYDDSLFPEECRRARLTQGKSALEPYLDDERLPRRIVLSTSGIRVAEGPE